MTAAMMSRLRPLAFCGTVVIAAALAGCSGAMPSGPATAEGTGLSAASDVPEGGVTTEPSTGSFDLPRSLSLTEQAVARQRANELPAAATLYREAALTWPGNGDAWSELARIARHLGDAQEARAAGFVADRLLLYETAELATQRAINQSLKTYLAEQADVADANPVQLGYATALSQFLDVLHAERGRWVPLDERGPTEIEQRDIPAALASAGLIGGYIFFGFLSEPEG